VTGVDLSTTFVEMAAENARRAGVNARILHGDAARLPVPDASADLVVCQAAFKNFGDPVAALDEMHRVLRPGRTAVIEDMNRDTTAADIAREVAAMGIGALSAIVTRATLALLRRRAYSPAEFRATVAASAFRTCDISIRGIGLEVRLTRADPG
jgi:ubiquinone/menaquinone biosynthesis C-methylase UbiE